MTFVIICLDGFKKDYLEKTKFLKGLLNCNLYGEINHGFGYASEYCAITGKDVEELGIIVNNFYYNPGGLKFFYYFRFLDRISFSNLSRLFLNLGYNAKEFLIGNNQPRSIFKIPLKYSIYFDSLIKKSFFNSKVLGFETIFDVLRGREVSGYMWPFVYEKGRGKIDLFNFSISSANTDKRAFEKSIKLLEKKPDVCYIHFFSTDNLVHRYGTKSDKTMELVRNLDRYVEEISKYADKLLIYSDHGMTDVEEIIDIWKMVENLGYVYGKDYVMFLDSCLARFWFFNDEVRKGVRRVLEKSEKGKFVFFKNEMIHRKFGELIFQVNPGVLILPNFYQVVADKATHGYDEESKEEKAFYILKNGKDRGKKNIKMNEIFDRIMKNI